MTVRWWKSPKFWDRIELLGGIGALAAGIIAVWDKLFGAIWGSGCGLVLLTAKYMRGRAEGSERADRADYFKRAIAAVLEALSEEYFSKVEPGERHNHRVTLFFVTDGPDGTTKQLQIYLRAGVFKASTTAFAVNEDEEHQCEGVAGRIWFCSAERTIELPDWGEGEAQRTDYAAKGFIAPARASELKVKSKVLSGTVARFGRALGRTDGR